MTFNLDISSIISLMFFIASVVAFYWKGERNTDVKLAVHSEKLSSIKEELDALDDAKTKIISFEEQLAYMRKAIDEMLPIISSRDPDIRFVKLEQRRDAVQQSIENLYKPLATLQTDIEGLRQAAPYRNPVKGGRK